MNIYQLCAKILSEHGYTNETLPSLVEKWASFVFECERGYNRDYSEYVNKICVRFLIQQLLDNEWIANCDDLRDKLSEVERFDQKFKSLLQVQHFLDGVTNWWEKGVLKRAGEDYCLYMYDVHGIIVEIVDGQISTA